MLAELNKGPFSTVKLLVIFSVVFSLASLSGAMVNNFHLPTISAGHGYAEFGQPPCPAPLPVGGCSYYWVPSGSAEDTLVTTIFTDEQAEFANIQSASPSIDFTDWPLPPSLAPTFTTSPNFVISSTVSQDNYYDIEFLLANNFWGVNFNFGNDLNGVQIRQGIAHLIDTASFATNEPSLTGQAVALDTPVPSDNIGSLPTANPCAWDASFPESGTNCIVGAPGGTAYHLGSAAGTGGFAWNQAPGSPDMNAAAEHFVNSGVATGFNHTTSVLTGISPAASAHPVNFFIRNDNPPRLDFGNSLAEQICYLFTGSYANPCAYLTVTRGPITSLCNGCCIFDVCCTSVCLTWGMYTGSSQSYQGPSPFDSSLYFQYNSRFVNGVSSIKQPTGLCSPQSVPTSSPADYMYLCSPSYDSFTNQIESAKCITIPGDPSVGSITNNSTGTCPGGGLSAVGAGLQAEDIFGKNVYTLPIFETHAQFGRLNNGWIRDINNVGAGWPNYFTWLDSWNPSPVIPGTIRQGFKQTTSSVSPFIESTPWDKYIVGNIYDSLAVQNPLEGGQTIDWSVLKMQQLSNSSLTYMPPSGTTTSFRFTLRSDLFFQDGRKVTAFDVAFSYLALKGTGAFAGSSAAPMTGVTILGPSQFDINLNTIGPFTILTLPTLPILPGAYWSNAGSSAYTSAISTCTTTNAPCYPAQYTVNSSNPTTTTCALTCVFPAADMNVNVAQTSPSYDPITSHTLVGSGPWECGPVTSTGSSTSCSSSGAQNPPPGGDYSLTRFGKGLAPGSSISSIYFRSNGNLATYLWSTDNGDFVHDFLTFSVVASCFGAPITSTGSCAHFQQGIGANGGPVSVGLSQVAIVNRFVGLNWIAPFNWSTGPPLGIVPLNPVLYENALTLSPASGAGGVGCTAPYPTGGYDC